MRLPRFYKLSAGTKTDKTYEQFCDSPYHNAFVKFGSWVNNVKPCIQNDI